MQGAMRKAYQMASVSPTVASCGGARRGPPGIATFGRQRLVRQPWNTVRGWWRDTGCAATQAGVRV